MSKDWQAVHVDELDSHEVAGVVWHPVRRRLGIMAFGTNVYTAEQVGGQIVEEHDETGLGHEEVYVVVRGHVSFTIDGDEIDAPAGTMVFISDPALRRVAVSKSEDALVLAVGAPPGKAYEPSAWEPWFLAHLAAEAGRDDAALQYLREAIAISPRYADRARESESFERIRDRI
jgi:quercetin dioxygenase-like cupin family protein